MGRGDPVALQVPADPAGQVNLGDPEALEALDYPAGLAAPVIPVVRQAPAVLEVRGILVARENLAVRAESY